LTVVVGTIAVNGSRSSPRSGTPTTRMATTLAPVDSREVVRCDHCLLVQFRTTTNNCRRCHASLDEEPEPEPISVAPPVLMPAPGNGHGHLNLATSIRSMRLRNGLSQRQLAGRMAVPRTYVSKIENEKAAYAVFPGAAGACTGGYRARTAQRRRTQPPGRNQRIDEGSVYRRTLAVRLATERDADVEHPDPGAGFDGQTEEKRVVTKV